MVDDEYEPLLRFFALEDVPPLQQEMARRFRLLALDVATYLPRNPERTVTLRKLLEARDAAVRAQGAK